MNEAFEKNGADIVLIAGPTASGKSALALALAEAIGGVVINADSMQVYRELRILTARPSDDDLARAPHQLYGHVPAAEPYSAGRFVADAEAAIDAARAQKQVPIFAGGTGLYLKSLIEPMSPIPPVPDDIRARWRARLDVEGAAALHHLLRDIDPVSAQRINAGDGQRLVRALEVHAATGRVLSDWHNEPKQPPVIDPARAARIVLWPERDRLRARIEQRFHAMINAGALAEAAAYQVLGLSDALPATRAHGLRGLMKVLDGRSALDDAIQGAIDETRQYAKRQFTWFRHQFADWRRLDPGLAADGQPAIDALIPQHIDDHGLE